MKKITPAQLKAIHTCLTKFRIMDEKPKLVLFITNGRTSSSRELTYEEAKDMLNRLNINNHGQQMRRNILSLGYEVGMIYGNTDDDLKMNLAKMNHFFKTKGVVKKSLEEMNPKELVKAQRQMIAIKVDRELHRDLKIAGNAVKELLTDLNVPVK